MHNTNRKISRERKRVNKKGESMRGQVEDRGVTSILQKRKNVERDIFTDKMDKKRQRAKSAATLSSIPHDAAFRRKQRDAKITKSKEGACKFVDYTVCDVDHYHSTRLAKHAHHNDSGAPDDVHMKWMHFEACHKSNGVWVTPIVASTLPNPQSQAPNSIRSMFPRVVTNAETHRELIASCKRDVWGDKLTHDELGDCEHSHIGDVRSISADGRCSMCGSYMYRHRFEMVCSSCGMALPCVSAHDRNFKETEHVQHSAPSYKRKNHLNEWISRAQAAERKVVPMEIKQAISKCFSRFGIDEKAATFRIVRKFLKSEGFQRYFEHVPQILAWLTRQPAPHMSANNVKAIQCIFNQIQEPFEQHKPVKRKNFLSYSYVLYKVCELLEMDEFLPYFPLLKSRANLIKADQLWKLICKDCNFEFLPTA